MAKAGKTGLIEQHAEKGILGFCGLLLIYVLFHWVLSSPTEFNSPSGLKLKAEGGSAEGLSPKQIDQAIREAAIKLRNDLGKEEPPPEEVVSPGEEIRNRRRSIFGALDDPYSLGIGKSNRREFIPLGDPVRMADVTPPPKPKLFDLDKIPFAPSAPLVHIDQERAGWARPSEVAAHVVATLDWAALESRWAELYKDTPWTAKVIVLSVQAKMREREMGGEWGDEMDVPTAALPMTVRIGGEERLVELSEAIPEVPQYEPGDAQSIDESLAVADRIAAEWQQAILQPAYPDIFWAPVHGWVSWRIHLPKTSVSERPPVAAPAGKGPRRRPPRPTGRRGRTDGEAEAMLPPQPYVPPLEDQKKDGTVLIWFHQDEGLKSRKEYQYKVRLALLNPLYTREDRVKKLEYAYQISLWTPYSDWSAPASVPHATEFFMVGRSGEFVRVTVFANVYGQRVRETFNVYEGEPIGSPKEVEVALPPSPGRPAAAGAPGRRGRRREVERRAPGKTEAPKVEKRTVDFSTGAICVELDFSKEYRTPSLRIARKTVEMLYLDYRRRLRRKRLAEDQSSARLKQLHEEVKRKEPPPTEKKPPPERRREEPRQRRGRRAPARPTREET